MNNLPSAILSKYVCFMTMFRRPDRVCDLIDMAADYIDKNGWLQMQLSTERGVCLVGAISAVENDLFRSAYDLTIFEVATTYLSSFIYDREVPAEFHDRPLSALMSWNDKPGRTKDEVVSMLRNAAVRWRQEETASYL